MDSFQEFSLIINTCSALVDDHFYLLICSAHAPGPVDDSDLFQTLLAPKRVFSRYMHRSLWIVSTTSESRDMSPIFNFQKPAINDIGPQSAANPKQKC